MLKDWVSNAATIVTVSMFLCPFPHAYKTLRTKSAAQSLNILPYVTTGMTAVLWLRYGLLIHDAPMRNVNAIGAVLEWIYSFVFFLYIGPIRPRKNAVILIGAISFLTSVLLLVKVMEHEVAVQTLGMVASVVNIVTFASPLATLKEVIRTSNCSSFPPLPLQMTMFVTPLLWFTYSQLIHDSFLAVPNFLGIILGIVQLGMRAKYPSRPADDYNRLDGVKM